MTKEQLLSEAMALGPDEREALAEALLSTTHDNSAEIEAAWVPECKRRTEAVDRGEMGTIPGEQVMRELRERLKR